MISISASNSQELTADANTLLLLHFNNNTTGAAGELPISSANISYGTGKQGNALLIGPATTLRFDTVQNFNPRQGTLEFWIKPNTEGVVLDMGTAGGLSAQVGNYTRMIFNIYGINGNPEVGVFADGTIWNPNTWRHLAFTWGNRELKLYHNGRLFASTTINFDIPNINLTYFNIGSTVDGAYQSQGLLDELRISNIVRSEQEICNSFTSGLGNISSVSISPSNINLRSGWNIYLNKPNTYMHPDITAVYGSESYLLSGSCLSWSTSNTNILEIDYSRNIVKAKGAGTAQLTVTIGSQSFNIPVQVTANPFPEERVQVIDPALTSPASCHIKLIPTVAYIYLPTNDGINIDQAEVGNVPVSIAQLKQNILEYSKFTKYSLEEGSKFRGYQNSAALPYVGYKIVEYVFVYEPLPRGYQTQTNVWFPDYYQIMERFNGKKMVDTSGVQEVWLWGYHWGQIAPVESNMSSPVTGDISNSNRIQDDMPVYNNTYILYNYNYERGGNEAVHNHGHQFESMIDYVCNRQDGNTNLFTQKFRGYPASGGGGPIGRVGDTHHPPNTTQDYDYCNSTLVASDILDWKPAGGNTTMINCNSWSSIPYQWPAGIGHDANSNFFLLWMQSFPGNANQISYGSNWMTNWWRFLANWNATSINTGLYSSAQALNVSLCNPYETQAPGLWNNPVTWLGNIIPPAGSKVIIKHNVTANINVLVSAMDVLTGGNVLVPAGIQIELAKDK